ncbi:KAT8 regulatory NSL complex subunit 1-like isoform X2 [Acipenser ruthenus]|uniref:KAT8 regulatory NSL complex subunit 1-like isoform X2 n=1 Tax=Acipenser ruthenus TaxID=7906 RepID=UPI0027408909|nr:KAT8 regulatory NSL complex subunit 1-like isoform X2 [Acipenser ruthenus]
MYFYFTWPKMNASAAGGGGSGVLPSSSSCNKRGSSAPVVNGSRASAALAAATAITPGPGSADSADSVRPQVCEFANYITISNNKSYNITALSSKESNIGAGGTGSADDVPVEDCGVNCYSAVNGSGEEMKKADSYINDDTHNNYGDRKPGDGRCVFVTTPAVRTTGTSLAASTTCRSSNGDPDSSLVQPSSAGEGTGQSEAATTTGDRTLNKACFLARHNHQGSRLEVKRPCFPSSNSSRATHCSKAHIRSEGSDFKEPTAPAAVHSSVFSSFPGLVNGSKDPHTAFGKIDRIVGVSYCGKEDRSDRIAMPLSHNADENSSVSSRSRREPKSAKGRVRLYKVRSFVASSAAANNTSNNNSTSSGSINGFSGALTQKRLSSDAGDSITLEEGSTTSSTIGNTSTTAGTQVSAAKECRRLDSQVNQPGDLLMSHPGPKARWADGRTCFVKTKEGYVTNRNYNNTLLQKGPLGSKGNTTINNGVSVELTKSTNGFRKALDLTLCGAGADCVDGVEGACISVVPSQGELEAGAREAVRRQVEMEARALRICKRLQVVQAKQVERHAVQQLKGLVESVLRGDRTLPGGVASVQAQDTLYRTSPLLCNALQAGPSHFGKHPFLPRTPSPLSLPLLPAQLGSGEMSRLGGSLAAALRSTETALDSDATASSSGGESDVEEKELGAARPAHRHRPLKNRVEWQWVEQRATVGSRWAWLQAQVSDLEYRIRQQTELYRHIRTNKVPVVLCEAPSLESLLREPSRLGPGQTPVSSSLHSPAQLLHNLSHQSSHVAQSLGSVLSPSSSSGSPCNSSRVLNGSLHSSEVCDGSPEAFWKRQRVDSLTTPPYLLDSSCVAARVRPLQRHPRRRLVRIGGAPYMRSKPLMLRCSCELPSSCILCGGRRLPTQTPDHSGCTVEERGAALEPSFHPILSFSHDLPLHLLVEGKLQDAGQSLSPHWLKEGRASPGPHRHPQGESGPTLHRTKEETHGPHRVKALRLSQIKRKHTDPSKNACHKLASSLLSSAKYGHSKSSSERLLKHRSESWQTAPNFQTIPTLEKSQSQIRKLHSTLHPSGCASRAEKLQRGAGSPSLYIPKPCPEALPQTTAIPASDPTLTGSLTTTTTPQPSRRRRGKSSFDINNIVIPMSMAVGARVEKLQYKEILTPSWRHLDPEVFQPVEFTSSEQEEEEEEEEEVEDTSDETYLSRHSQWEERERSRWGSWAPSSTQRRVGRPSIKGDGRLTPQPPLQSKLGLCQPASPPEPCPPLLSELPYLWTHSPPEPWDQRGRVFSFSEDTTSSLPDDELLTVQPWELRCFPLSDGDLQLLQQSPEDKEEAQQIRWPPGTGRNSSGATGSPSTQDILTESTDPWISLGSTKLTPTSLNPQVPHCSLDTDAFPPPSHRLAPISLHPAAPHCSLEIDTLTHPSHRLTPIFLQPPLSHSKHGNPLLTSQHPLFSSVLPHLTHRSPPDTDDSRTLETAANNSV